MVRAISGLWVFLVALLATAVSAEGARVYKWVAPDGVTHFSEAPPPLAGAGVRTLDIVPWTTPTIPPERYRSLLEIADSIEADRLERERLRLERLRLMERAPELAPTAPPRERYYLWPYPAPFRPYSGVPRRPPPPRAGPWNAIEADNPDARWRPAAGASSR